MPLTKIAGFLHTFTDGLLLLVPEQSMPFVKEPKKVLQDFEAEFYLSSPVYDSIVEVRVDVAPSRTDDLFQGLDHRLVTLLGEVESRPSRGIEQRWIIAEQLVTHAAIAVRAYETYLRAGGSAEQNWLRAEETLLAEQGSHARTSSA
jgi:hypothetical protein